MEQILAFCGKIIMFIATVCWTAIFHTHKLILLILENQPAVIHALLKAFWLHLLIVAIFIVSRIVIAIVMSRVAKAKGYKRAKFLILCLLFGSLGCICILCLPDLNERKLNEISKNVISNYVKQ
jgi:MFS family permease